MHEVYYYTGSAWNHFVRDTGPVYNIKHGSVWHKINAVRPYHGSCKDTLDDIQKAASGLPPNLQKGSMEAPTHVWNGSDWWPPESSVFIKAFSTQSDGSWLIQWVSIEPFDQAHKAATSLPPIRWEIFKDSAGLKVWDVTAVLSSTSVSLTREKNNSSVGIYWVYILKIPAAVVTSIMQPKGSRKHKNVFYVDGETPYGPYLVEFPDLIGDTENIPPPARPPTVNHPRPVNRPTPPTSPSSTSRPSPPEQPTHFTAVGKSSSSVMLTWTLVPGATSYTIKSGGRTFTTTATGSHYLTTGLNYADHRYPFTIVANGPGGSSRPASTHAKTLAVPTVHHTKTEHHITATTVWDAAYDGNTRRRGTNLANPWQSELVQGRFDSTHGNTHSIIMFKLPSIPSGATITKVTLTLKALHWYSHAGGTVHVRMTHFSRSVPPHTHAPTSGHVTSVKMPYSGSKTFPLEGNIQRFANGSVNALQIGPGATKAQTEYGVIDGSGGGKPILKIHYKV